MKERTSNLSVTGLILGIMSVITVFGGYTALLGVVFGLFGILFSARGRRIQRTRPADHAMRISVFGFVLCLLVSGLLVALYLYSGLQAEFDFDLHSLYDKARELFVRIRAHI